MSLPTKRKAIAYITSKNRLLVFEQPDYPEAGVQVPAGTVEPHETPDVAVMREAAEESGLIGLTLAAFLGERVVDMSEFKPEIHHRYFYHLRYDGESPERWQHIERHPSDGDDKAIVFELYWVDLPDDVPSLIAGLGDMLPGLITRMGL